jgi:hypothetical protein
MITVTFFADHAAAEKRQAVVTLAELAALIRDTSAPTKAALPWVKCARFGNARSPHGGSLRHDRNVIAITGIEADYDGGKIGFDNAVETADKAGLLAVVYTSPSHQPGAPRWRVLAPTSREYPPADRARLLGRLNGLYRGVFARESWTLSQAYYFGRVGDAPAHRIETIDGEPIDRLDELDRVWLGPPTGTAGGAVRTARELGAEARDDAELVRRIVTGDGYHVELTALAARYLGRGMPSAAVAEVLRGLMLARRTETYDDRWRDRIASIGGIVRSAAAKFAPEAERRRAIARLTHRLARQRRTGTEIKQAIIAEAARLDLEAESALAIGNGILSGARHARE